MQLITLFGAALCLAVLYWRYKIEKQNPNPQPRKAKETFETAKVLWGALIVLLAVSLHLRQLSHSLDHAAPYEMSLWGQLVAKAEALSK